MKITKDTICCISIAEKPGSFGSLVFNATFQALKLDYIYKPFKVAPADLEAAVRAVRALGIRGCGVSMPHKTVIGRYLDEIDPIAAKIGAINTVVNDGSKLTGYNTDFIGVQKSLREYVAMKGKSAHIIGAGGAARAVIVALQEEGAGAISISNRDETKAQELAKSFKIRYCPNSQRAGLKADLLINATPIGMAPDIDHMAVAEEELANYQAVMDVVVSPLNTKLISSAEKKGKTVIPGYRMSLYQAAAQFTLYTGLEAPMDIMLREMKKIIS